MILLSGVCLCALAGCSMNEEIRRIDEVKRARLLSEASRSTNLTGEQIFIRSCNTCHPGGRKGPIGPGLEKLGEHFQSDRALKAYLRSGKGIMPSQPTDVISDKEMDSLIDYLRALSHDLGQSAAR